MPSVSYSETSSYLLCHRKHYYGYTQGLQRVTTSSSLALGSAGHRILQAFYQTILDASQDDRKRQLAAFDTAAEAALAEYELIVTEGFEDDDRKKPLTEIIATYLENEPFVLKGWLILAVEREFVLEYGPDKRFPFVIDLIANDPDGKTVVVDHKFVYDFYTYNDAALQPQIPLYIGGLRALDYKIDYGAYNMLRNRKIKVSTVENSMAYLDLKPNGERVQRTFLEQIDTADEIMALKALGEAEVDIKMHRVANKMVCQSCSFRDLCTTELVGGNTKLMVATEYKIRVRKIFAEASVEASTEED